MGHVVVSEYKSKNAALPPLGISLSAFNLYLGGLSNRAIQNRMSRYRGSQTEEGTAIRDSSSSLSSDLLHQGWEWIVHCAGRRCLGYLIGSGGKGGQSNLVRSIMGVAVVVKFQL
ncbi:hypothetical protein ACA910_008651 [Epithemia clementina (nom. ined.)]